MVCAGALSFLDGKICAIREPSISSVSPEEVPGKCQGTELAWFGHVTRHDSLSRNIPQSTLEGGRRRGRQRKCWVGPCPCQNCSQGPRAEKTGRGSPLIRPSCPPDDPIGQGTERNGTEVNCVPREIWSHYSKQVGGQLKRIRLKIAKKCRFYLNIFSCVKINVFRSFFSRFSL